MESIFQMLLPYTKPKLIVTWTVKRLENNNKI